MKFNPIDLLLIGIFIYILVRHFRRMGQGPKDRRRPPMRPQDGEEGRKEASDAYERAQRAWDMLRSEDEGKDKATDVPDVDYTPADETPDVEANTLDKKDIPAAEAERRHVPEEFDEKDFLEGAKAFGVRIRDAWNNRDLLGLREFCTEECMEQFRQRAQRESRPARQDILLVNAGLVEVRDLDGGGQSATVYYEITERDASSNHNHVAHEIWRYVRRPDSTWLLDDVRPVQDEEAQTQ